MVQGLVLQLIFPCIGCVVSAVMYMSSLAAVLHARKTRQLGELNPGFLSGIFLVFSTHGLASPRTQDLVLTVALLVGATYGTLAIVSSQISASDHTKSQIWGFAAATFQVLYYTAPLSTLVKVVRRKDSASLHLPLCVANCVNVTCWLSYGVAARLPFIWVPETLGGCLAATAMILRLTLPQKTPAQPAEQAGDIVGMVELQVEQQPADRHES